MVFSLIYFYLTTLLPDRNLPHTLGSDFVPRLLVICLFILTLFLFFQNLMSKKEDKESDRKIKDRPESVFNILLTIFVITLYISLMIKFGYLITTPVFMLIILWIAGCRHWKHLITVSLLVPLVVYYVFYKFFHVPLP